MGKTQKYKIFVRSDVVTYPDLHFNLKHVRFKKTCQSATLCHCSTRNAV